MDGWLYAEFGTWTVASPVSERRTVLYPCTGSLFRELGPVFVLYLVFEPGIASRPDFVSVLD